MENFSYRETFTARKDENVTYLSVGNILFSILPMGTGGGKVFSQKCQQVPARGSGYPCSRSSSGSQGTEVLATVLSSSQVLHTQDTGTLAQFTLLTLLG
jgi:hypothetical protein